MSEIPALQRLTNFLKSETKIEPLTPDASTREYFRVVFEGKKAIACVYPLNDFSIKQLQACVDVTSLFLTGNLPVAKIFAIDEENGVIIHEDFGDKILRSLLLTSPVEKREKLIAEAIEYIARIQALTSTAIATNSIAAQLKFDEEKLNWEFDFFTKHYFESLHKSPLNEADSIALKFELNEVAKELASRATVVCHRDFHAANLMIDDAENIKIIDHQDARLGSVAYDLVSLLLDRVTESPDENWLIEKQKLFLKLREKHGLETIDLADFQHEFLLMTIQRCLKAIGTFSYQTALRDKKGYAQYINPMFQIVAESAKRLKKFVLLQKIIGEQIDDKTS